MIEADRDRRFPERGLGVDDSIVAFLSFIHTTSVNKLVGLSDAQARRAPVASSPALSLLGLVKHMTAVLRQHVQIHIGGSELASLWRADDLDYEFRIGSGETIDSVIAAFDDEFRRSLDTLSGLDLNIPIVTYDQSNTAGRLLVDVLQELARHLGHMDITRELIDGTRGE